LYLRYFEELTGDNCNGISFRIVEPFSNSEKINNI
jgi:hypothetical protein